MVQMIFNLVIDIDVPCIKKYKSILAMRLLSIIVMSYKAGLTDKRSILATWTLAVTFAAVLALNGSLGLNKRASDFSVGAGIAYRF